MTEQKIHIAYFSGTGGTAMAAKNLAAALEEHGASISMQEIRTGGEIQNGSEDYLVLLFPAHAFNAPEPVYNWLDSLNVVSDTSAAVIAVSGGGEISPNTAMRQSSIQRLKKKGYNVVYEDSIVMPSNIFTPTPKGAAVRLLRALPGKTAWIADDILAGRKKKLKARLFDRILSRLYEIEKFGARIFGKRLYANEECSGCGLCAGRCPTGNIRMKNGQPVFGKKCCLCLKCVYACPENAISPKGLKFIVLKEGFDIKALEEKEKHEKIIGEEAGWKGVYRYLNEVEERPWDK